MVETDHRTNPAGRLYLILIEALTHQEAESLRQVWATVLDIDSDDTGEILAGLAELIDTTGEARAAILGLDGVDQSLHLRALSKIEEALSATNLTSQWAIFKRYIEPTTMQGLEFTSETLSRIVGEQIISDEELHGFREDVDSLLAEVIDADIPADLKAVLDEHLEGFRRAIVRYQIRGAAGLKQAVEESIGAVVLLRGLFDDAAKDEKQRSLSTRFFGVIATAHRLVAFALDLKKLGAPIAQLLLGSGNSG